jgi:hypothetical protein
MRAKEFTINVPINIKINGDGEPEIDVDGNDEEELDQNPVMMSPQQQELELRKAEQGKTSPYIDTMTGEDENVGDDEEDEQEVGAAQSQRNRTR